MPTSQHLAPTGNTSMKYKVFGRKTGLRLSELALGVGMFGTRWGKSTLPSKILFYRYSLM